MPYFRNTTSNEIVKAFQMPTTTFISTGRGGNRTDISISAIVYKGDWITERMVYHAHLNFDKDKPIVGGEIDIYENRHFHRYHEEISKEEFDKETKVEKVEENEH